MAASELRGRAGRILARSLIAAALVAGCASGGGKAKARPEPPVEAPAESQEAPEGTPEAPAEAPAPVTPAGSAETTPAPDLIRIERSAGETAPAEEPAGLYEAALEARRERAERTRRATTVITDATLASQARRGEITAAGESAPGAEPGAAGEDPTGQGSPVPPTTAPDAEAYWRQRVRQARLDWRAAVDRIDELEEEAAKLRWDFYAADDPYFRDSQIKPAWDRALAELAAARQTAEAGRADLEAILLEGQRAGALPGWLREGLELEPVVEETSGGEPPAHDVEEPVEIEEADGGLP